MLNWKNITWVGLTCDTIFFKQKVMFEVNFLRLKAEQGFDISNLQRELFQFSGDMTLSALRSKKRKCENLKVRLNKSFCHSQARKWQRFAKLINFAVLYKKIILGMIVYLRIFWTVKNSSTQPNFFFVKVSYYRGL